MFHSFVDIHLKSERRYKDDSEEDIVSSDEEAIEKNLLAIFPEMFA
jgi:hypothetical protein